MSDKLKLFSVLAVIVGCIFIGIGFYKKNVYESNDYSWSQPKNMYVGGDAYNYIINGTYFTGYVVIGSALIIIGGLFYTGAGIIETIEKSDACKKYSVPYNTLNAEPFSGKWKCPDCAKINNSYETTCKCGCAKP